ncbi:Sensor histidine kinase RegB [Enhygromyxa salina]|uniref:histidine kinase n=1 Tax=Enhygromyxa salina TaxID=215803 RepID=A0A2S9XKI7_9BACT|nr:Sensor histidine kinase RegB [Enhygromyxa salina]
MTHPATSSSHPTSAHITLRNLVAARWVLLSLVAAASILELTGGAADSLATWLPATEHPWATFTIIAVWAGHNGLSAWLLARDRARESIAGVQLLIDASALTVLLGLAGGSANPFTILYFLPITLATQVSPRWTWALAAWSLACFASLFVLVPAVGEGPMPEMGAMPEMSAMPDMGAAGMGHGHFEGHLRGMWIAFGLTGVLMTFFVHRIALAIARQRAELVQLRQDALEDRHLAAIGTLAAGAAHELGTPLGTMKLLADEFPLMDADERKDALATIREQLARCKLIVSRMASPELRVESLGVDPRAWRLRELAQALRALEPGVPLEIQLDPGVAELATRQPFEVLAQLLRELVANAAEACRRADDPEAGIEVRLMANLDARDLLRVEVRDRGVGMSPELLASAFDPFFSTRPEGSGMGLGLYLARAHLRQLGGSIALDSTEGVGTTVRVQLPLTATYERRSGA